MRHHIEGTTLFDGDQAQKGYALNRMCFSFNSAEEPRRVPARTRTPIARNTASTHEQREAVQEPQRAAR